MWNKKKEGQKKKKKKKKHRGKGDNTTVLGAREVAYL